MASGTYRYEISNTNKAFCQNSACKNAGVKIQKGEFRFGSLVTINEHSTWKWKHWGCVTPLQIGNIVTQIGGLEGLDLDNDLDILDGYDELPSEAQEKIKYALQNGHVHDDDWKGDPELNRPGQKGINKRAKKKKDDDDDDEEATPVKPKKGRKKVKDEEDDNAEATPAKPKKNRKKKTEDEQVEQDHSPAPKSKKKSASSKKRKADKYDDGGVDVDEDIAPEPPKKKRQAKKTTIKSEDVDSDEPLDAPTKKNRGKKVKEETTTEAEIVKLKTTSRAKKVKREEGDVEEASAPKSGKASQAKKVKQENAMEVEPENENISRKTKKKTTKTSQNTDPVESDVTITQLDGAVPEANTGRPRRGRSKAGGK